MTDRELDRILSEDLNFTASSGFADAVMGKVLSEAAAPPPIPFPWVCALPGLVAWAAVLGLALFGILKQSEAHIQTSASRSMFLKLTSGLASLLQAAHAAGLDWMTAAILLTFASIVLSLRLARISLLG